MEEILSLLKMETSWTVDKLAEKLNKSKEEVKAQLEFLENIHYIKKILVAMQCNKTCKGCSNKCLLEESNKQYIWTVCK